MARIRARDLVLALLAPCITRAFQVPFSSARCIWISVQMQLLPPERTASSGAVVTLSRYADQQQPTLYNTSVSWADFDPYGTRPEQNFTYSSAGTYIFNVSTLSAVNQTWLPPPNEYRDPATLVVTLFTQDGEDRRPVYIEGTNATNSQTVLVNDLFCDLYLDDEGNYNGYYLGKPTSSDDPGTGSSHDDGGQTAKGIGIIVGAVLAAILVVALIIWSIVRCDRRRNNRIARMMRRHSEASSHSAQSHPVSENGRAHALSRWIPLNISRNGTDETDLGPTNSTPKPGASQSRGATGSSVGAGRTSLELEARLVELGRDEPPPSYAEASRNHK